MNDIQSSALWKRTLGQSGGDNVEMEFRERLRGAFKQFRERVKTLSNETSRNLPQLTVHDITHIDALWGVADVVIGIEYAINPTEAFVLGGAFLLHDVGLALAAYPNGAAELRQKAAWGDAVARRLQKALGRPPRPDEIANPSGEIMQQSDEDALRSLHAERAEDLGLIAYQHRPDDSIYHLIEDTDLRSTYGRLIGRIAYSHWSPVEQLLQGGHFDESLGAFPGGPAAWTISPLKLALILRTVDSCHLDSKRAPGFLRTLRKPSGYAESHWRIQELLQQPTAANGRIRFTSANPVPRANSDAWWTGYDLLQLADRELRDAESALTSRRLPLFAVHGVEGIASPSTLRKLIPTEGWIPVDTSFRTTDVASLIRKIGGQALYGNNPTAPLRELIQNARDAVVAHRVKTGQSDSSGSITVRLVRTEEVDVLEIEDSGVGMSVELLSGPLLDFGNSYWSSQLCAKEHPGLLGKGFDHQGQFGIGFFSVFMLGDRITVTTRRHEDSIEITRVLEFSEGLDARPMIRPAGPGERLSTPGTRVRVELRLHANHFLGLLSPIDSSRAGASLMDFDFRRRTDQLRLVELCEWLCPAMDVDLVVEEQGVRETAVVANDWKTIQGDELFRRLLIHRADRVEILSTGVLSQVIDNLRALRDPSGNIIGRAALTSHVDPLQTSTGRKFYAPGVVTAGCFRAEQDSTFAGLLIGRPTIAARSNATRLALDYPKELADWATLQASLVHRLTVDFAELARFAGVIRSLNGNTGDLPIANYDGSIVSYRDIASMKQLPSPIDLIAAHWSLAYYSIPLEDPRPDLMEVSEGRFKLLYHSEEEDDFRCRANHPRWRQYWMSLWGATIEAIAEAWGVQLQQVLELSLIHANGHEDWEVDGRQHSRALRDIIRKPPP